jgi:hypothetical protein
VKLILPALAASLLAAPQPPAPQAQRTGVALVIGNSAYKADELPTVEGDKAAIAKALRSQHFSVVERENLDRPRDFEAALQAAIKDAVPEETLLVYYAGHGVQIEGKAHLVGTGIPRTADPATLREFSLDVDLLIRWMERAAPRARVLIVDACRNNPFATTSGKAGVAFQRSTANTYIIFADEPGKTVPARSDSSLQGPLTAALLHAFENSDEGLEGRFKIVREMTMELNPGQTPQLHMSDGEQGRSMPFIDRGGRSAPTLAAESLLDDAKRYYDDRSWPPFRDKVHSGRILASDPVLKARFVAEHTFVDAVQQALKAEQAAPAPKWSEAAEAWQKAAAQFPARAWVVEKAAIAWLMDDRIREGVQALARLQAFIGSPVAKRAELMLGELTRHDAALGELAKSVAAAATVVSGPEFERYVRKQ